MVVTYMSTITERDFGAVFPDYDFFLFCFYVLVGYNLHGVFYNAHFVKR